MRSQLCEYISSLMKTYSCKHRRCKGKQSAPFELLLTPTSTPPPAPPPSSAPSYSSTSSPLPPSSYMLLSALVQDEASGHVGISPNSGSRLNTRVGEDVTAALSEAANRSPVGDKKPFNLCSLEDRRSFTPLPLPVELLKLCRKSEKLRLLLLSSMSQKMSSSLR